MGLLDDLSHMLTLQTTFVVGRTSQFMLYTAVDQNQTIALRMPGEILVFATAAIQTDQAAVTTEYRGKLVHDTALHTTIVVLGCLTDLGQFIFLDTQIEHVVQGKGISALQGS